MKDGGSGSDGGRLSEDGHLMSGVSSGGGGLTSTYGSDVSSAISTGSSMLSYD